MLRSLAGFIGVTTCTLASVLACAEPNSLSSEVTLPQEPVVQVLPATPAPVPLKAENVDLKDVVDPSEIAPALEIVPAPGVKSEPVPEHFVAPPQVQSNTHEPSELSGNSTPERPLPNIRDSEESNAGKTNDAEISQGQDEPLPQITKIPDEPSQGLVKRELVMLNSAVSPGTAARLSWQPGVGLVSTSTPVLVVNGAKPGPTLCLTAAVHGDELNGIEIVRHILYNVDPEKLSGALIGVPIVNLQGFQRSSRYLPDRRDLNRYFPGYNRGSSASRMAHSFFTEVIMHCDYLVDLHTGSFRRTNLPQLRANLAYPDVASLTKKMGAIVVLQSKGHPGSLRAAAVRAGVPTVTMELGQPHQLRKDIIEQGIKSVEILIDSLGMAKRLGFFSIKPEPVYYQSRWVRAGSGGILFSSVALGDRVSVGSVLGVITDPITNARQEIVSPHNGRVIGMALNQVMYPGFAAYHIGLRSSAEEAAEAVTNPSEEIEDGIEKSPYPEADDYSEKQDPRMQEDS